MKFPKVEEVFANHRRGLIVKYGLLEALMTDIDRWSENLLIDLHSGQRATDTLLLEKFTLLETIITDRLNEFEKQITSFEKSVEELKGQIISRIEMLERTSKLACGCGEQAVVTDIAKENKITVISGDVIPVTRESALLPKCVDSENNFTDSGQPIAKDSQEGQNNIDSLAPVIGISSVGEDAASMEMENSNQGFQTSEKLPVPERKRRNFYPKANTMSSKEIKTWKSKFFENTFTLFKLEYPASGGDLTRKIPGLARYIYQKDGGTMWSGIKEYWEEYVNWVKDNKTPEEYAGPIIAPVVSSSLTLKGAELGLEDLN